MKKTFTFLVVTLITLLLSGCELFINTNPVESEEYLEELCDITVHSFESKKMTIKYTFDIHFGEEKEEVGVINLLSIAFLKNICYHQEKVWR